MGVSVILDLNEGVFVSDLRHFLSFVPKDFDERFDLRMQIEASGIPQFLEIQLSAPEQTVAVAT